MATNNCYTRLNKLMRSRILVAVLLMCADRSTLGRLHVEAQSVQQPGSCRVAPAPPTGLTAKVELTTVELRWKASPGFPTSYVIEAGSTPRT